MKEKTISGGLASGFEKEQLHKATTSSPMLREITQTGHGTLREDQKQGIQVEEREDESEPELFES